MPAGEYSSVIGTYKDMCILLVGCEARGTKKPASVYAAVKRTVTVFPLSFTFLLLFPLLALRTRNED